jgi:hypothetical protein
MFCIVVMLSGLDQPCGYGCSVKGVMLVLFTGNAVSFAAH